MPERKMRAQDRYAQETMDYLWTNADELCEASSDGIFYRGSMHMLIRKIIPSAQAGDVVSILKESGAIYTPAHGLWELRRKDVFFNEDGSPVDMDTVSGNKASLKVQQAQAQHVLNERVSELEGQVESLKQIILVHLQWHKEGSADEASVSASRAHETVSGLPSTGTSESGDTPSNEAQAI
jgi:hypothetical protein